MDISTKKDRFVMGMVINLVSNKKMKILEYMLEKKVFTQYEVKKSLGLGMSTVNQTFNFLLEKEVIKQENGKYILLDLVNLLELIAFFKNMENNKIKEIGTSLGKKEIMKIIPKNVVFCLNTALEQYSNYYKTNNISLYGDDKVANMIKDKLKYLIGNKTIIKIYFTDEEIIPVKIKNKKYTNKIKTIVDMYCDKRGNAVEPLVKILVKK
jgi:hypothetical protein